MGTPIARFPGRSAIEAYGNGGFRFAGMSHRGSILCFPSAIEAWDVTAVSEIDLGLLDRARSEAPSISFLLLGTGRVPEYPVASIRAAFVQAGIGLEVMDTGAAARTYNVLLAEGRPVAAALIAVA